MRMSLVLALLIGLLAPAAFSQERARNPARGWYVGAEAGLSRVRGDISHDGATIPIEDESHVLALHAGYRFNRILSLGAYVADFGSFSATRAGYSADANLGAFGVQLVGRIPVGEKFGLSGIAMAFFHDMDFTARVPDGSVQKDDGGGLNARFGLGANYQLGPHAELRLDFLHTVGINRGFMTFSSGPLRFSGDLSSLSLGVRYKF